MNDARPPVRLALTPGEPAGIGPDIALKSALETSTAALFVIADPDLLAQRASELNLDVQISVHKNVPESFTGHTPGLLNVIPVRLKSRVTAGELDPGNSAYVLETLKLAADYCLKGRLDALVTGPVHKGIINDAGYHFSGHTEFLADLSGSQPVMMLATEQLRVALATTHLPLSEVSRSITQDGLIDTIRTLNSFLRKHCRIERPSIWVCGLNPHAGEGGHLGMEEIDIISPAIERCRQENINVSGPLPADTVFTKKYLSGTDAVLAMYHDQGLPVLKYSGFGEAVNITLGLPFIRTSVDHGTALELAGSGKAGHSSMLAAIKMAQRLVNG